MRHGFSLVEGLITVAVLVLMAGMSLPRMRHWQDRIAVDAAAASTMAMMTTARETALRLSAITAVRLDTSRSASVLVIAGTDTIALRPLGTVHGVRLETTRDSIAFGPAGLGFGAANTRIVLSRGAAADTVYVSRLGRPRR